MRISFPWSRPTPAAEPVPAAPAVERSAGNSHAIDVDAIAREAASAARVSVEAELGDLVRTMISSSPMLGAMDPTIGNAPFPAYVMDDPLKFSTPLPPQRRPGSLVTVNTLRQMADNYDVLRACIQHLKREVASVPLQIVPVEPKDDRPSTKRQIKEAQAFLSRKGGLGGPNSFRAEFEGKLLEDLIVVGAGAAFYAPNKLGGIYAVQPIDAATIRPSVDPFGYPGPGAEIYEQWILGIKLAGFTRERMLYAGLPINARSYTPYYASPVEWLINAVNSALRADDWNRRWLTDGTTVADAYAAPPEWSVEKLQAFTVWYNAMVAGDSSVRQQTRFLPAGSQKLGTTGRKDQDFGEYELWLLRRTCATMGVQPASIGFAGEQYKVSQTDSMQSTSAFGAGVLLDWRQLFYEDLFQERMGLDRIKAQNVVAREEDAGDRAKRNSTLVTGAMKTPNEARAEEGLDPIEGGDSLIVSGLMTTLDKMLTAPVPDPNAGKVGPDGKPITPGAAAKPGAKAALSAGDKATAAAKAKQTAAAKKTARAAALETWEKSEIKRLQIQGGLRTSYPHPFALPAHESTFLIEQCDRATTPDMVRAAVAAVKNGIYICRHAQTDENKAGRLRGWLDFPLNKQGKKDAKTVGKFLVGAGIQELHCSDLRRAVKTAKIIAEVLGMPIAERNFDYRDWSIGQLDGRGGDDIGTLVADLVKNKPDQDIPAGEGFNTFKSRALTAISNLMARTQSGQTSVAGLVSHSSVISVVAAWIAAGQKADFTVDNDVFLTYPVQDSSILWLTINGDKWNCTLLDPLADGETN